MNALRPRLLAGLAVALVCAACGNKGPLFLPAESPATTGPQPAEPREPGERDAGAPTPTAAQKDDEDAR